MSTSCFVEFEAADDTDTSATTAASRMTRAMTKTHACTPHQNY